MIGTRRRTRLTPWLLRLWLGLVLMFSFAPLLAVAVLSFNRSRYGTLPFEFTLSWYDQLFAERDLLRSTLWNLELSAAVGLAAALLGPPLAIWLRRAPRWASLPIRASLLGAITVPWLLLAVGMLLVLRQIGIGRSIVSMFLACLAVSLPYVVLLVQARLAALDPAIEQAAQSLGAPPLAVFLRVTLPLIASAVGAGGFMAFITCFNNFIVQYFMAPIGFRTLPLEIYTMVKMGYKPDINALGTILVAASILLVVLLQRLTGNAGRVLTMTATDGSGKA
ncbi:ABC transporter permease [Labrys wisconsinensis]|uniref:Spermidine/putrescine transport system permease protein n=1 Tax=Labrys wisconsinensis TaxID=425677 RepID=A0ABU0JAK5_9HYPH|nr:ABC transporter permease [Labrys wisconsinensis]MDQ0470309.1 spermidine/putrescine transport system permease protein [Labrys wisconsinensis]